MTPRFALPAVLAAALAGAPAGAARAAEPGLNADQAGVVYLDVRDGARAEALAEARTEDDQPAGMHRAARRLVRAQGPLATLEVDPTTGTVRTLADLGGALTGASDDGPVRTANDFVRANLAALGLTAADLATLRLDSAETTSDGITHVRWTQVVDGVPAFDNGLTVALDRGGRIVAVGGSPLHRPDPNRIDPALDAADAVRALGRRVGMGGDTALAARDAELVLFDVNGVLRLAWRIRYQAGPAEDYDAVIDAVSGRLLRRANLVKFAAVPVKVFPHYPGAAVGGSQVTRDIEGRLFDAAPPTTLAGAFARVFSDVNDSDTAPNDGSEDVDPTATDGTFTPTWLHAPLGGCAADPGPQCSWDSDTPNSWTFNRAQNAIGVFYLVNRFRDHLATLPIGFDQAHGGFECDPDNGCSDDGDDRVIVNTDDGAALDGGLPDADHLNNANMGTLPDGLPPTMQMYLFEKAPDSPFRDINGGDSPEIVFHEYTHGLSNRLVVDSGGFGALNSPQSAAMGEGWSDWYAMDFLARPDTGNANLVYVSDTAAPGEVDLGAYTDAVPNRIRSQPLDCPIGASPSACPGDGSAGSGGYTYGDFGNVCTCGPEVHADGEIWAETLWDLRTELISDLGLELGSDAAEQLITGGMRLSPPEPSFLDVRNAILEEASALPNPDGLQTIIWDVFSQRGMGFFAGTIDGNDTAPAEDFLPPPGGPTGVVTGTVRDGVTGRPVGGATISVGGHTSSAVTDAFTAQSASDGTYTLPAVPQGVYRKVVIGGVPGYDSQVVEDVGVSGEPLTLNVALARNWASSSGGGTVAAANDDTGTSVGCGPGSVINQSQGNGWSPFNPADARSPINGTDTFPSMTIALPRAVDISSFAADPSATCGDGASATTRRFKIETSTDGTTFATAFDGTGTGAFVPADAGRMRTLAPISGTTSGVRFVRLTLLSPQDECDDCSGKEFIDFTELAVYGNGLPTGALSVPGTALIGQSVTFDASSITDDGAIVSYAWDFNGDGSTDLTTTGATTSTSYPTAGTFSPRVRVSDGIGVGTAGATIVVSAPPPPDGGPSVPPTPPTLKLTGLKKPNGVSLRIVCATACGGRATLTSSSRLARRLKLTSRAFSRLKINGFAGRSTIRLPIKRSILRKLRAKRIRAIRLTLNGRVTDTGGLTARIR